MNATRTPLITRLAGLFLVSFVAVAMPAPIRATPPLSTPVANSSVLTPLYANQVSWNGFSRYWMSFVRNADRVLLVVGVIAVAALFIITRGKWL